MKKTGLSETSVRFNVKLFFSLKSFSFQLLSNTYYESKVICHCNPRKQFDEFNKSCPEGVMTRRKFLDLSTSAMGEKGEFLADALFR